MANTHVKSIPLADLKVSSLNMRHGRKKPDVSDILPSIRAHGVRQSLLVRAEGNKFGVIAGRRRLFALRQVAKETDKDIKVPCILMKSASEADAIEASLIENVARVPATEMEQYTAFQQLHGAGRSVDEIADYYGITPLTVKRVLALANLLPPIRKAYSDGDIDRETIRALTLATEDQQTEWLTLFNGDGHAPRGRACRAWITGGDVITTDKALFDLESYDGDIVTDLFGEHGVFADAEAFWAAQVVAVSERVDAYTDHGWSNVHVLERGRLLPVLGV
ncbi:MAG: ParB/RepB/Spo0J family partition protein [Pseudomonadota bacterium]